MRLNSFHRSVNRAMQPLGLEVRRREHLSVWDVDFVRWIREADERGIDPNDLADAEWSTDLLDIGLAAVYGPLFNNDCRILELGPGTGRLSRHAVGETRHLTVVDRSDTVCEWMTRYLLNRGPHSIFRIVDASIPMVDSETIDAVVAHGVFEHLDLDVAYWFLSDFCRVLKSGGVAAFNFDNATSSGGVSHLQMTSGPSRPSVFRFHAPDAIRRIARAAGFAQTTIIEDANRIAFASCQK